MARLQPMPRQHGELAPRCFLGDESNESQSPSCPGRETATAQPPGCHLDCGRGQGLTSATM